MISIRQAERLQSIRDDLEGTSIMQYAEEQKIEEKRVWVSNYIKQLLSVRESSPQNSDGRKAWKVINLYTNDGVGDLIRRGRDELNTASENTNMEGWIPVARKISIH